MNALFIKLQNNRGQFVVMVALAGILLLLFIGFSISEGYLSYRKIQLRRVIDASGIVGMNSFVNNLNNNMSPANAQLQAATDVVAFVKYNLKINGIKTTDITMISPADPPGNTGFTTVSGITTFTVTASLSTGTLVTGLLRMPRPAVNATATAKKLKAYIIMVLDTSGSMTGSKISNLKTAAISFINQFDLTLNQDHIAIVSFSTYPTIKAGLNDHENLYSGQSSAQYKSTLTTIINNFSAAGSTNFSAALVAARLQLEKGVPAGEADKAIVLISDGAPTAMYTRLTGGTYLNLNYPPAPDVSTDSFYFVRLDASQSSCNIRYYSTTSEWLVPPAPPGAPAAPSPPPAVKYFYGASDAARWYYGWDVLTASCSYNSDTQAALNCLSNMGYLDSKGNPLGIHWGSGVTDLQARPDNGPFMNEFYNLAIIEGDYVKDGGATIYTIGVGTSDAAYVIDPYNNAVDSERLHPNFMRRLSNAPPYSDEFYSLVDDGAGGFTSTQVPKTKATHPVGIYFQAPNSSLLANMLNTIAQKIKLKLVQ